MTLTLGGKGRKFRKIERLVPNVQFGACDSSAWSWGFTMLLSGPGPELRGRWRRKSIPPSRSNVRMQNRPAAPGLPSLQPPPSKLCSGKGTPAPHMQPQHA